MADLAARGYTGVLHTFSENDFAYYRDTMAEIVAISHDAGLTVQASPWGLGRTFGGEAESRWVAFHPEECQVLDDGRRVAAACLNSSAYRDFCKEWADWVLECGVDSVFWDEPAWVVPAHVGVDDASRWTCRCDHCAERFGGPVPAELTPEVQAFREASVVGLPARDRSRTSPSAAARTRSACSRRPRARRGSPTGTRSRRSPAWTTLVDRSVLEALGRARPRTVRAPLRPAAPRDGRPPRRRGAALGAELRARRATTSPSSRRPSRRARGGRRRPLDVGLRSLPPHDALSRRPTRRSSGRR